jgi:predicted nucleotide-binding protein
MSISEDLAALAVRLRQRSALADDPGIKDPISALNNAATSVGTAWSGSWLGYQSRVYYEDFAPPPPGARFSQEWGFMQVFSMSTTGNWREYRFDDVVDVIERCAGVDTRLAEEQSKSTAEFFEEMQSTVISKLTAAVKLVGDDPFLDDLLTKAKKLKIFSPQAFVDNDRPRGQVVTRDMQAMQDGFHTPPHIAVLARVYALGSPFHACGELAKVAQRAAAHLADEDSKARATARIGTNVFIGHGRSAAWKDLREFVRERLRLPWDEFNRVPVAGVTNIARLSQMLDSAAIAFLVMTAEDEQADGKRHARMNVVHEAGLFQGRLGFERAIVILEEGCEEFSNIQGLGQIRFPAGNISAVFEDIRQVLEREGLVE